MDESCSAVKDSPMDEKYEDRDVNDEDCDSSSSDSLVTAWVRKINASIRESMDGNMDETFATEATGSSDSNPRDHRDRDAADSDRLVGAASSRCATAAAPHLPGDRHCEPCVFFFSCGCSRERCPYCHLHYPERVHRPCKAKRERIKKRVAESLVRLGLLEPDTPL